MTRGGNSQQGRNQEDWVRPKTLSRRMPGWLLLGGGGWIVGLPGTFGYGRIHVGWLTGISTVVFVAAYLWSRSKDSRSDPESTR
jgi:hypothetical protein